MSFNTIKVNNTDTGYTHSIFDISEYTGKTYDTLSDALTDVPDEKQKGGMTVSFVSSTNDNKYVQYLYIRTSTEVSDFRNTANWEKTNLDKEFSHLENIVETFETEEYTFPIPQSSSRTKIGEINFPSEAGDTIITEVSRTYNSLTGGRIYYHAPGLYADIIPNGVNKFVTSHSSETLEIYDDSDTSGNMTIKLTRLSHYVYKEDFDAFVEDFNEIKDCTEEINDVVNGINKTYKFNQPIASGRTEIGKIEDITLKKGNEITIDISRNYTSLTGGRLYYNNYEYFGELPNGEGKRIAPDDINKLLIWDDSNTEGVMTVLLSVKNLQEEIVDIQTDITNIQTDITDIQRTLYTIDETHLFHQPIASGRTYLGEFSVDIKAGDEFFITPTRDYTSLTYGRMYINAAPTGAYYLYEGKEFKITASVDITKLIFFDDSETEGTLTIDYRIDSKYVTKEEIINIQEDIADIQHDLESLENKEETHEFNQPIASSRTYLGEFSVYIKAGEEFVLDVERTYTSLTNGRVYQNAAPDLLGELPNGERVFTATKNITKLIFWDDSNTEGTLTITFKQYGKFIERTESKEFVRSPYTELYGTVIGDSHAMNRARWVPYVYERLGVNYDPNIASYVVGINGNSCGEGYEDYLDPVYAQAVRAVEKYQLGNRIDFILLDNVHYVYEGEVDSVVPFKLNQLVNLGELQGQSSEEPEWFNSNFSSIILNIPQQNLGTVLKSIWSSKKYILTFSGTPVSGTTFSLIIDGNTYDTPVNIGDTLATFVNRVAEWIFANNWSSSADNNKLILSYTGSGVSPSLTISYNSNSSGISMTSEEGVNKVNIYRYYLRKDFNDWNNISAWVRLGGWSAPTLKGAIEYLLENIPEVKIIMISLPYYPIRENDFNTELGQDQEAFFNSSVYITNKKRAAIIKNLAEYYNLPFVDFEKDGFISLSNYFYYYPENDVHPNNRGYKRLADTICTKLGF